MANKVFKIIQIDKTSDLKNCSLYQNKIPITLYICDAKEETILRANILFNLSLHDDYGLNYIGTDNIKAWIALTNKVCEDLEIEIDPYEEAAAHILPISEYIGKKEISKQDLIKLLK